MAYSNCDEVRLEFSAWLDDELSAAERRAIEAHLAECPACQELFRQFQQVDEMYQDLAKSEAPAELEAGIRKALTTEPAHVTAFPRSRHARQRVWPLLAAAAVFAILAGGVLMMATEDFGPEAFQIARFDERAEEEEAASPPEPEMDMMMEMAPDALEAEPMDPPREEALDDPHHELLDRIEHDGNDLRQHAPRGLRRQAPEVLEQDELVQRGRPRAEEPAPEEPRPYADRAPEAAEEPEPEAEPVPPPPAPEEPMPERLEESPEVETREAAGRRFAKDDGVWVEESYEGEPVSALTPDSPVWEGLVEDGPELAELAEWREPVVFKAEGQWRRLIPLRE